MPGDGRVLGEHGTAEMVVQRRSVARQSARAGEKRARSVGRRARLAERRPALGARGTVAATWNEDHDDMVSDLEVGNALPEFVNDAGSLVTERHRHGSRSIAVDDRQIGVAQARGRDLDEHLTIPRRREIDGRDLQRLGRRIWMGGSHVVQHGGSDLHSSTPSCWPLRQGRRRTRDRGVQSGDFISLSLAVSFMFSE